jgi:hypothetical protein
MSDYPKATPSIWFLIIVLTVGSLVEGIRIALGHTYDLRDSGVRIAFILGCLTWALAYATFGEEPHFKKYFGLIAILIAVALTWFQLRKLGETGWDRKDLVDRCAFLLGSIALLSKGMKDFYADDKE